jgi:hypothetical protein
LLAKFDIQAALVVAAMEVEVTSAKRRRAVTAVCRASGFEVKGSDRSAPRSAVQWFDDAESRRVRKYSFSISTSQCGLFRFFGSHIGTFHLRDGEAEDPFRELRIGAGFIRNNGKSRVFFGSSTSSKISAWCKRQGYLRRFR